MSRAETTTLWRPIGQAELDLIAETDYRRFPPRLPEQPIFYPVCNEEYACEIAEKWNARDQGIGYVTRFEVRAGFLAKYKTEVVGAQYHEEYWIPAEELDAFNDAIVGQIEVVRTFREAPMNEAPEDSACSRQTPLEMIQLAVTEHRHFKMVGQRLADEQSSRDAALWLVEAYKSGESPPWMTAYLLGQIGHEEGYAAVKEILLLGPGSLAESYAGPALARIDPVRALADLSVIIREGSTRRIREGAAYGLGRIGGREAVAHLVNALRAGDIFELAASGILAPLLEDEEQLRVLLANEETRVARTGLLILEC